MDNTQEVILGEGIELEEIISLIQISEKLEVINISFQILANICVILGAIFAVYQYIKQKKLVRISNAIDLAKYFATDIIDRACLVYAVFCDNEEIMDIIAKHSKKIEQAQYFNKEEYESIFTEEERKKYDQFIRENIHISKDKAVPLSDIMQDTINELEHCCISFNTGLAEEKAVYQSMHQVIFNLFPCVYPWIGSINKNNVDLFYTNLCELYVRWSKIRKKSLKREEKIKRKLEKMEKNRSKIGTVRSPKI